jgi:hypothetical protein
VEEKKPGLCYIQLKAFIAKGEITREATEVTKPGKSELF